MVRASEIRRFALYGEGEGSHGGGIAPEFVHIEPISRRSRPFEGTIAPHAHPGIFQLLLVAAGSGVLAIDGNEAPLGPGSLVALPSGCVHAFRFARDAEGWVLSLAAALLNDPRLAWAGGGLGAGRGGPRWTCVGEGGAGARLGWLFADLAEVLEGERGGLLADTLAAELALVLATAERLLAEAGAAGAAARRGRMAERFRELVELHFRDGWSVGDYVRALGTTGPTLTRRCREALGRAPGEVVLDRVLLEAMRRLTYTGASVSEIAGDLGFVDAGYFARFFKRRCGMTARAFRQQKAWLAPRR